MGTETKFGLLVGVIFIVLFGFILAGRAGSTADMPPHALLPVGGAVLHETLVQAGRGPSAPYTLVVPTPVTEAVSPPEESLPAAPATEAAAPVPAPAPRDEPDPTIGLVAFAPVEVVTPAPTPRMETPAPSPAVPSPAPARKMHKVAKGETLISIARLYYGREGETLWKRILEANADRIRGADKLVVGQELVIPGLPASPAPAAAPDTALVTVDRVPDSTPVTLEDVARMFGSASDLTEQPAPRPATYTVRSGDTFYKIAVDVYRDGRMARLLEVRNKHLVPDPRKLQVGQKLLLLDGVDRVATDAAVARR